MSRLRWLSFLMSMVILLITGFQVYWLRDNYRREKKGLEIRTASLFSETVQQLQDSMLRKTLSHAMRQDSSTGNNIRFKRAFQERPRELRILGKLTRELVTDSGHLRRKKGVQISINHSGPRGGPDGGRKGFMRLDSVMPEDIREVVIVDATSRKPGSRTDTSSQTVPKTILPDIAINTPDISSNFKTSAPSIQTILFNDENGERIMIRMDSLMNDSIPVSKLQAIFTGTLQEQNLSIPFSVSRSVDNSANDDDKLNRPGSLFRRSDYALHLGNTFPYLVKRISTPILFSIFLVGLTIFSFIILYRNMLRQHRLAEMKNDLISNITHELKTPIATVGVAIEALKNFSAIHDTRKTNEYLDISQQELQRLSLLVDKVLKVSMFENKKIALDIQLLDLEDLVKEVAGSLRLQLEKQDAILTVQSEGDVALHGDKMHLLSVIFNLLDNALKYSSARPVIHVQLTGTADEVKMEVIDNGIGIPEAYRDRVFEKFFRVPAGDTHNAKGHGLGLSYTASVIKQHKGMIVVTPSPGAGSTFIITLPKQLK